MKLLWRTILPALLLATVPINSALAQTKLKVATVDLRKLFDNYWKTKTTQAALDDRKAELDKEDRGFWERLDEDEKEYEKLLTAANDQALSSEERTKRREAADDKLQEIQDSEQTIVEFERQARATLADQVQRIRSDILKEIHAAVDAKARASGYSMVIDSAAETLNETLVVLYTSTNNDDLTAAVLAQLNAGAPINLNASAEGNAATNVSSPLPTPDSASNGYLNTGAF
ncbi:MAG: OmpH family outer membrane protein [Verrucomicrobiota bacterium]|nr:OmpH family outer membrane protein [Verrucomicrobiota bacterium]